MTEFLPISLVGSYPLVYGEHDEFINKKLKSIELKSTLDYLVDNAVIDQYKRIE